MSTIAELKSLRASKLARANEIAKEMTEEASQEFEALKAELEALNARINDIAAMNAVMAEEAEPVEVMEEDEMKSFAPARPALIQAKSKIKLPKGTKAARFLIGAAVARKSGSHDAGTQFIKNNFGDMEVVKELNSSVAESGAYTIPQVFRPELIEILNAKTVVRAMGAQQWPMPEGNLKMPAQSTASSAFWIGESNDIPSTDYTFDEVKWEAKKLAAIIPVTNDLLRRSPLALEQYVRSEMINRIARKEDNSFLLGVGSATTPTGLLNLASSANKFNFVSATYEEVLASLRGMELALTGKNVDTSSACWIMHPVVKSFLASLVNTMGVAPFADEIARGQLLGYPVHTTANLPTNLEATIDTTEYTGGSHVFFVNANDVVIADTMNMQVDSTSEASVDVGSGTIVSAFQRDMTFFRTILEVDINVLYPQSVAVGNVFGWTVPGFVGNAGSDHTAR